MSDATFIACFPNPTNAAVPKLMPASRNPAPTNDLKPSTLF